MSLINQMLQDLAQRRERVIPDMRSPLTARHYTSPSRLQQTIKIIASGMVLAILLILLFWTPAKHHFSVAKSKPTAVLAPTHALLTNAPEVAKTIPMPQEIAYTPALLQNSTYTFNDNLHQTMLRFSFDKKITTNFTTNIDDSQQRILIALNGAAIIAQTHLFQTLPPGIAAANAYTEKDKVIIALQLLANTHLAGVALDQSGMSVVATLKSADNPSVSPSSSVSPDNNTTENSALKTNLAKNAVVNNGDNHSAPQLQITSADQNSLSNTEAIYQQALSLANNGQGYAAMDLLRNLLKTAPDHRAARQVLASLEWEAGEWEQAEKTILFGLQQEPDYYPYTELQAHLLAARGNVAGALKVLEQAKPLLTTAPDYYAFMAALNEKEGKLSTAITLYQSLTANFPDHAVWWMGLGIAYDHEHVSSAALAAYQKALALGSLPTNLNDYVNERVAALQ